jgi:hypothetical protein
MGWPADSFPSAARTKETPAITPSNDGVEEEKLGQTQTLSGANERIGPTSFDFATKL